MMDIAVVIAIQGHFQEDLFTLARNPKDGDESERVTRTEMRLSDVIRFLLDREPSNWQSGPDLIGGEHLEEPLLTQE